MVFAFLNLERYFWSRTMRTLIPLRVVMKILLKVPTMLLKAKVPKAPM